MISCEGECGSRSELSRSKSPPSRKVREKDGAPRGEEWGNQKWLARELLCACLADSFRDAVFMVCGAGAGIFGARAASSEEGFLQQFENSLAIL